MHHHHGGGAEQQHGYAEHGHGGAAVHCNNGHALFQSTNPYQGDTFSPSFILFRLSSQYFFFFFEKDVHGIVMDVEVLALLAMACFTVPPAISICVCCARRKCQVVNTSLRSSSLLSLNDPSDERARSVTASNKAFCTVMTSFGRRRRTISRIWVGTSTPCTTGCTARRRRRASSIRRFRRPLLQRSTITMAQMFARGLMPRRGRW